MASDLLNLCRKVTYLAPICAAVLLGGCLVPLPLEAENTVDGGRLLMVTDATMPAFGTQIALNRTVPFEYTLDVLTDARALEARLYVQTDGNCCDLDLDPAKGKIDLLDDEAFVTPVERGRFRVVFQVVRPCQQVPLKSVAYVIPVLAAGGFLSGATDRDVKAAGALSKNHYWSVQCQ